MALPELLHLISMAKQDILVVIDQAVAALKAARLELVTRKQEKSSASPTAKSTSAKRGMSEEGRQKIAEAQRKRWAKQKRAAKKAARLAAK